VKDPRVSAGFGAVAALYFGYAIFAPGEAPSPALGTLHWIFFLLGLFALVGSIIKIATGK
jgi:hypothetical protein